MVTTSKGNSGLAKIVLLDEVFCSKGTELLMSKAYAKIKKDLSIYEILLSRFFVLVENLRYLRPVSRSNESSNSLGNLGVEKARNLSLKHEINEVIFRSKTGQLCSPRDETYYDSGKQPLQGVFGHAFVSDFCMDLQGFAAMSVFEL
ncbi:hypothetical protein M9H77_29814 [Catharanthus roseus]|uniref:Uncharacterized protein n=1 Tax=Catharanthus roseus TaxID=4058 RepID=A0ACB9ZWS7_CATRO|nr:hypothetical protein M9H77_29814 [Catharanthus roseus]